MESNYYFVFVPNKEKALLLTEGLALANYTFTKHKSDPKPNKLENIYLSKHDDIKQDLAELVNTVNAVYLTRDLIKEPVSHLTAKELAESAVRSAELHAMKVTVFNKKKIESLKMGGLLAVNKGSMYPEKKRLPPHSHMKHSCAFYSLMLSKAEPRQSLTFQVPIYMRISRTINLPSFGLKENS